MSLDSLPKLEKDTAREQKEISSHESQAVPVSYIQEKQGSNTRWTVSRVRPVTPDQAKISKKQPRKLGMKKDVTKMGSGESKKSKVRSSRRFFIRNNNKALRKRRQFLRSKEINRTQETEKSPTEEFAESEMKNKNAVTEDKSQGALSPEFNVSLETGNLDLEE